jgi:hypothetical protein
MNRKDIKHPVQRYACFNTGYEIDLSGICLVQINDKINNNYLQHIQRYLIDMTRSWIIISNHCYLFTNQRYLTLTMT